MKFPITILLIFCINTLHAGHWRCTTESEPWQDKQFFQIEFDTHAVNQITLDTTVTYQEIEGWGGSFNEIGWAALLALDEAQREDVMKQMFDPEIGLKFNICRVPIGASDFTLDNIHQNFRYPYLDLKQKYDRYYSLNDHDGDFDMHHFSIKRDQQFLIPYIKAAMKHRPDLKIWGSPWTPPHWMMTNFRKNKCEPDTSYAGYFKGYYGDRDQEKYKQAYADYFARFVTEYQNKGIDLYAIHVQNEFSRLQYWVSCVWTGSDIADFIGNHLGPRFKDVRSYDYQKLNEIEIWHGTIHQKTNDVFPEFKKEVLPVIDPESPAEKYVTGVSYQYRGYHLIDTTANHNPRLRHMASETACGRGKNDFPYALKTWEEMKNYLSKGVHSYMQWNMVLDDYTKSSFKIGNRNCDYWAQNAMITIHTSEKKVVYNPQYYIVKHFSHYVTPGAKRIKTEEMMDGLDVVAFLNPDHQIVIQAKNESPESLLSTIRLGEKMWVLHLPGKSVNTLLLQ